MKRIVVIVGVIVLVAMALWIWWPTAEAPKPISTVEPAPTITAPASEPEHPVEVLPEGPLTNEAVNMTNAAVAYVEAKLTIDFSTPFPGFDIERMVELSAYDLKEENTANAELWADGPMSRSDQEFYEENPDYRVDATVTETWVTPDRYLVVMSVDTDELTDEVFSAELTSCDNEFGWCVENLEQGPIGDL